MHRIVRFLLGITGLPIALAGSSGTWLHPWLIAAIVVQWYTILADIADEIDRDFRSR